MIVRNVQGGQDQKMAITQEQSTFDPKLVKILKKGLTFVKIGNFLFQKLVLATLCYLGNSRNERREKWCEGSKISFPANLIPYFT